MADYGERADPFDGRPPSVGAACRPGPATGAVRHSGPARPRTVCRPRALSVDTPSDSCRRAALRPIRRSRAPRPVTGAPRPVTGASRPVTGAPRPVTGAPRPVTGAPRPVTGAPHPVTGASRPVTGAPRPVTGAPAQASDEPTGAADGSCVCRLQARPFRVGPALGTLPLLGPGPAWPAFRLAARVGKAPGRPCPWRRTRAVKPCHGSGEPSRMAALTSHAVLRGRLDRRPAEKARPSTRTAPAETSPESGAAALARTREGPQRARSFCPVHFSTPAFAGP